MQTEFAQEVGKQHGLARGLEGSKARHTSIQQYYARVEQATPKTPAIDVPEAKMLEGKESYGRRVAQSVLDQIGPEVKSLQAKAAHADLVKQQAAAADRARRDAELRFAQREKLLEAERQQVKLHKTLASDLRSKILQGGKVLADYQAHLRAKMLEIQARTKGVKR
jgi:hypothetical protein